MSAILTQPGISSGAAPKQTIVKPANVISISPDITSISSTLRGYIQRRMESFNCSAHDVAHVYRVSSLTIQIAAASIKEDNDKKNSLDLRTAYIAGLCHDLLDPKFGEPIGVENELRSILRSEKGLDDAKINVIIQVAKSVGYKNLIKPNWDLSSLPYVYRCVQDADLLDAIGAIGIGRCFTFGGGRNKPLFTIRDPALLSTTTVVNSEAYTKAQNIKDGSSIEHFFEKLLRLKDMMLTKHGKALAEKRHTFMVTYIRELAMEISGHDGDALLKACLHEDDENELKTSNHNGVILCLLDEELGDRPSSPSSTSGQPLPSSATAESETTSQLSRVSSSNVPPQQALATMLSEKEKKRIQEEAELKRKYDEYEEISKQKFQQIFRSGLLGLVVESLEMDSWFGSDKKKIDKQAKGATIIGPSTAKEINATANAIKKENPQATFAALANNTV